MTTEGTDMAGKRSTPEQIVAKLRQAEVLTAQGKPVAEAARVSSTASKVWLAASASSSRSLMEA